MSDESKIIKLELQNKTYKTALEAICNEHIIDMPTYKQHMDKVIMHRHQAQLALQQAEAIEKMDETNPASANEEK